MKKKIAVILVNYNGVSDTIECIQSLYNSSIFVQIVVVDNASKNNELSLITKKFPAVKTIQLEANIGFAGGNNVGIKWALENGYEYISLLNNDTIIDKDLFKNLLECADEKTVAAPYMYYHSHPNELWYGGGYINRWTGNAKHIFKKSIDNSIFECSFVTGCCFIAHRLIWKSIGLLDESYFMYHEDTDFCIRLKKHNCKIKINPTAKIWHKVGQSGGGENSAFSIYYNTRNRLICIKKYKFFFHFTAELFSITTRCIRMLLLMAKGRNEWTAFYEGLKDAQKNIIGSSYKG